jgi:hypothetical protein
VTHPNEELIRELFATYSRRDLDAASRMFMRTPSFVIRVRVRCMVITTVGRRSAVSGESRSAWQVELSNPNWSTSLPGSTRVSPRASASGWHQGRLDAGCGLRDSRGKDDSVQLSGSGATP